jgi:signal peptidase II
MVDRAAPGRSGRMILALVLAAVVLALDLQTKAWAWDTLRVEGRRKIIDGVLHFEFAFNTGSAFGMLRDASWARTAFVIVTIAALAYMVRLAFTMRTESLSGFFAVGLITGGALGNLHDRLLRSMLLFGQGERHGVVDFIVVFYWPARRWPAFNIADVVLLVGVGLFLLYLHRTRDLEEASSPGQAEA